MLDSIVIIPLAGFNDDKGKLSLLSIQRLEKCVQIGRNYKNSRIVLSGGVGQHFNPINLPHFLIQEEYLSSQLGWSRDAIGKGFTGSLGRITNTVEEAIALYNEIICPESIFHESDKIIVVTSPFHFERSKYLIDVVYSKMNLERPELNVVQCEQLPTIADDSNQDISFLNPNIPKCHQDSLYRYFMTGLTKKQKEALEIYEKKGLQDLKINPYGKWLDFIENH